MVKECVEKELKDKFGKFREDAIFHILVLISALLHRYFGREVCQGRWAQDHDPQLEDLVPLVEAACAYVDEQRMEKGREKLFNSLSKNWELVNRHELIDPYIEEVFAEALRRIRSVSDTENSFLN